MATRKQIQANRRNSQKSTGPRTEAGKEIVSRNAITHGLEANRTPVLPGEEETFARFEATMAGDLGPETPFERMLVNKLIQSAWKAMRLDHIEAGVLSDAILKEQEKRRAPVGSDEPPLEEQHQDTIEMGRAYMRASPALSTLTRYRVKLDHEFYKALGEFRMVQYARICMYHPQYVANLKRFSPPPDEWKTADQLPMSSRLSR